jgi:hypothetical protein
VVKILPHEIESQPEDLRISASHADLPRTLIVGCPNKSMSFEGAVLAKIVYGNKDSVASIDEKTGCLTLLKVHCSGQHDLFVGRYRLAGRPEMVLQRVTVTMDGHDLPDCRPQALGSWARVPGPSLQMVTVGSQVSFSFSFSFFSRVRLCLGSPEAERW